MTDDAHLVAAAREGSLDAFDELVRRHQDRAYRLALRLTGDPHDAQDVVQDAFVQAWGALRTWRGEAAFTTWLHRIVVNRASNARRDRRPTEPLPPHELLPQVEAAERGALASARREAAVRAVAELPFEQRSALALHYFADFPLAEVARILGITEGAAKVRVHRARRSLARRLEDWR
ncbi:RNA polymerase sigma factor [Vallicoccus soli]|uniref:RNA polymerase sigma factor n=1 Tax=Vallicoccus soli TaxID=2339232 RepID=UPI001402C09F|nr:sigma-70 family RNA polymerase sigma factor [Vallicoccus soli]